MFSCHSYLFNLFLNALPHPSSYSHLWSYSQKNTRVNSKNIIPKRCSLCFFLKQCVIAKLQNTFHTCKYLPKHFQDTTMWHNECSPIGHIYITAYVGVQELQFSHMGFANLIINVSSAGLTPLGVIYGSQV